jgi:hypothetical protein
VGNSKAYSKLAKEPFLVKQFIKVVYLKYQIKNSKKN